MFSSAESRYNAWVREHYRFLLHSAWALAGSRALAEDVVQDCFAAAWRHRDQLRQAESVRAWLFQIMRRSALRHLAPGPLSLDEMDLPEQASPDAGLDDRLDVVKALAHIAPIHREVLVLYYFDDMSTKQRLLEGHPLARGQAAAADRAKAALGVAQASLQAAPPAVPG